MKIIISIITIVFCISAFLIYLILAISETTYLVENISISPAVKQYLNGNLEPLYHLLRHPSFLIRNHIPYNRTAHIIDYILTEDTMFQKASNEQVFTLIQFLLKILPSQEISTEMLLSFTLALTKEQQNKLRQIPRPAN